MKGSHSVEDYIEWLNRQEQYPLHRRIHLMKTVKQKADQASTFQTETILELKHHDKVVMAMRFFEDGSMDVGYPGDAKWGHGDTPPLFPTGKELV